jgi:hypothetical protein
MKNLNSVAEDLFNKIRGRFPSVTIGDEQGTVTTVPEQSRFYDFAFKTEGAEAGKVSISLDEENGITVIVGKDIVENQPQSVKSKWFDFLRELRQFAKKRMLQFDVRDINKSNLQKRDYKHLAATRPGESTMAESKMYGTNRTSYQRIGGARLAIKHLAPINTESTTGRTQKIGSIFIESPDGERFRYPYRHLSGARAMARHVAEGGTAYDEFGQYISSLSEELNKLRKFSTYINRSGVMAETLGGYADIVKERAVTIRKEIQGLQKENYYREAREGFTAPIVEDVPEDVSENWIDQLTIRQFNEELKDVFPYIYKLVGEATRAKAIGPDDLDESGLQRYTGIKKYGKAGFEKLQKAGRDGAGEEEKGRIKDQILGKKKTKEEIELETAFESTLGQFSDYVCEECGNPSWHTLGMTEEQIEEGERHGNSKIYDKCWKGYRKVPGKSRGEKGSCVKIKEADNIYNDPGLDWMKKHEPYIDYHIDAANNALKAGNMEEREKHRELARAHRKAQMKWEENRNDGSAETISRKVIQSSKEMGVDIDEGNAYANAVRQAKMNGKKKGDEIEEAYVKTSQDAINTLGALRKIGKKIETGQDTYDGNLANMYANDVYDVISWVENNLDTNDPKYKQILAPVIELRKKAKGMERELGSGKDARFGNEIVNTLYPLMQWIEMNVEDPKEGNAFAHAVRQAKMDGKKKGDKIQGPDGKEVTLEKEQKTPLGEFILSYFDRETGKFPKGETAVLTAVGKDYGDEYVESARQFIEKIESTTLEYLQREAAQSRYPETEMIKRLAGM